MLLTSALLIGLLLSLLLSAFILASLYLNPRIWIGDAPPEMQAAVEPLSAAEKCARMLWALPIFGLAIGLPVLGVRWYESSYGALNFLEAYVFLWVILMSFNVIDLVIIDWLIVVTWHPAWANIPEVAHLNHLNTYRYHFEGFLKGSIGISVVAGIAALLIALL